MLSTALRQTVTFLFYILYQMEQDGKVEILNSCILFFDMRILLWVLLESNVDL